MTFQPLANADIMKSIGRGSDSRAGFDAEALGGVAGGHRDDPPSKRHRRAEEIDRRVPLLVSFSPRAREEHSHAVRWPETACDVLETARADFREWSAVREICRRGCRIEERAEASSPRTREGIKTRLHERRHRSRLRWATK
jgi:hypothetical protein